MDSSNQVAVETRAKRTRSSSLLVVISILLVLLVAMEAVGLVRGASTARTHWEYTVEAVPDLRFDSTMSELGEKGWELVFARRARDEFDDYSYECIFKRPH